MSFFPAFPWFTRGFRGRNPDACCRYLSTREAAQIALLPSIGDNVLNDAASGCIAELAGSVLFTPMEVLKARMQISRSGAEGKLLFQLRDIAQKEGFSGFYRGYVMGIASYIPFNILWWSIYGTVRRGLPEKSAQFQIAVAAGSAAALSAGFIHPLELVKTRYQVSTSGTVAAAGALSSSRNSDQKGLRQVVRNVMKESGPRGFYAGFVPTLLRSVPSSIIVCLQSDDSLKALLVCLHKSSANLISDDECI